MHAVVIAMSISVAVGFASVADAGTPERKQGNAVIAGSAEEGPRDLEALMGPLAKGVTSQPFGQRYKDLIKIDPAPKDGSGQAKAKTHPALKHDPIEMQEQVQFLEETGVEARYGLVSIRVVRVFRYGTLGGAQLVFDRIRKNSREDAKFDADLAALKRAFANPLEALKIDKQVMLSRHGLQGRTDKLPLRLEFEPRAERKR